MKPVRLIINGCPPGWGAKNRRFKGRFGKVLTDEYKTFQDYVWIAWMDAGQPRFDRGGIAIELTVYWPRKRTFEDGFETGMGDVDAVSSAVLDALQDRDGEQRCIDNDMRVVEKLAKKDWDKKHPRVEVWIRVTG